MNTKTSKNHPLVKGGQSRKLWGDSKNQGSIQVFQAANGALEIQIDQNKDTVWLTQSQISILFGKSVSTINEHIKNIFVEEEVLESDAIRKFGNSENSFVKPTNYYNLDLILSVGYRTNSKQATVFRQWASTILKDYLVKGYVLNQKLLEKQKDQILEIQNTLKFLAKSNLNLENSSLFLDILNSYTNSLITLNQFDEDRLAINDKGQAVKIEIEEYLELINETKSQLIKQKEATELFGQEYEGKFQSTIGAVNQAFGGQDVYPTVEQKAAHLLYFVVKNHSFADGNKRIGAILFVYFLKKNNFLHTPDGELKINQNTLVALALLIAQSNPNDKEIMIKLVIKLIQN